MAGGDVPFVVGSGDGVMPDGTALPPLIRNRLAAESKGQPSNSSHLSPDLVAGALGISIRRSPLGWLIIIHLRDRLDRLSARERDVAERFARDANYSQIAAALGLAPATARRHIQRIYERLGIHSKIELIKLFDT